MKELRTVVVITCNIMNNKLRNTLCLLAVLCSSLSSAQAQNDTLGKSGIHCNVNWKEMMKDHDLIWKKSPIGNERSTPFG
jgi:hypothetical protein